MGQHVRGVEGTEAFPANIPNLLPIDKEVNGLPNLRDVPWRYVGEEEAEVARCLFINPNARDILDEPLSRRGGDGGLEGTEPLDLRRAEGGLHDRIVGELEPNHLVQVRQLAILRVYVPVVGVPDPLGADISLEGIEHVRPGADRIGYQLLQGHMRGLHEELVVRHPRDERGAGVARLEHDREIVRGRFRHEVLRIPGHLRFALRPRGVSRIEAVAVDDVLRGERHPIMPLHVFSQVQGELGPVGANIPAFREPPHENLTLLIGVERDEVVVGAMNPKPGDIVLRVIHEQSKMTCGDGGADRA